MDEDLLDLIYEAAVVPEAWPRAIEQIGQAVGAATGALLVFEDQRPIRFTAAEPSFAAMQRFVTGDSWYLNRRLSHYQANPFTGFVIAEDYFPAEVLDVDETYHELRSQGLASQAGTIIAMPTGEIIALMVDRPVGSVPFGPVEIERLNVIHPHLARASLLSARLGLGRAEATLAALTALGLPSAILSARGAVLDSNAAFNALESVFRSQAFEQVSLLDPAANALFRQAVERLDGSCPALVRSLPVPAADNRGPFIIHVLPIAGVAQDIFSRAASIVIVTPVRASGLVPTASILTGLFDLTPAETRLAAGLAAGMSLADYIAAVNISMPTARSHLAHILQKTGTTQQSQLVALLKSAGGISLAQPGLKHGRLD